MIINRSFRDRLLFSTRVRTLSLCSTWYVLHCGVYTLHVSVVQTLYFFVNRRVTRCQQLASNPTLRCTVGALLLLIVNDLKTSAVFKQERGWRWWWLVMRKVLQRKVWKAFSKPPAAREGEMRMKFSSFSFFLMLHSPFFPMIARLEEVGSDLTGALRGIEHTKV